MNPLTSLILHSNTVWFNGVQGGIKMGCPLQYSNNLDSFRVLTKFGCSAMNKSTDTPHHFIRKILVTFVGENLAFYWDFWWVKTWSRSTQLCNKRKFKRLFCDFTDFWSGFRLEEGVWVPVQNQGFCFLLKFWRRWLTQKSPEMIVSERAKSQLS